MKTDSADGHLQAEGNSPEDTSPAFTSVPTSSFLPRSPTASHCTFSLIPVLLFLTMIEVIYKLLTIQEMTTCLRKLDHLEDMYREGM